MKDRQVYTHSTHTIEQKQNTYTSTSFKTRKKHTFRSEITTMLTETPYKAVIPQQPFLLQRV